MLVVMALTTNEARSRSAKPASDPEMRLRRYDCVNNCFRLHSLAQTVRSELCSPALHVLRLQVRVTSLIQQATVGHGADSPLPAVCVSDLRRMAYVWLAFNPDASARPPGSATEVGWGAARRVAAPLMVPHNGA